MQFYSNRRCRTRQLFMFLWALVSASLPIRSNAQTIADGLLPSEVPQAISPTAMEMGRYGKHPVSFFTGTPQISIPLAELRAKGRTLPIYLSYHSGGNRPDLHPGWVGQGWSLHCGGSITRIVNNRKDEMSNDEYQATHSGPYPNTELCYLKNAASLQAIDWSNTNNIINNWGSSYRFYDTEPDEFQVSMDDLQASFYFISENAVQIKSKSDASFTVQFEYGYNDSFALIQRNSSILFAPSYRYIKAFTITKDDGTVYHFGGDISSIEYSVHCKASLGTYSASTDADRFVGGATVNNWLLTSIEYPDGESIVFSYEKEGTPVQRTDSDYLTRVSIAQDPNYLINDDSSSDRTSYPNVSFMMMRPSYLRSVRCTLSGDSFTFNRAQTVELKQVLSDDELIQRTYAEGGLEQNVVTRAAMKAEDRYFQLSSMAGIRDSITFSYTNNNNSRLKLLGITFRDCNGVLSGSYEMHYNPLPLPAYGAKQTDRWGYYNGKDYEDISWNTINAYRSVDTTKIKAEILTRLDYPAGGYSEFTYEPNSFSRIQWQYPGYSMEQLTTDNLGGGLRIKKIKNHASDGNETIRRFEYKLANGRSSGVSSGLPSFYEETASDIPYTNQSAFGFLPFVNYNHVDILHVNYVIGSESAIRPLSSTDGAHITYDIVTEIFQDGGKRIYEYSNHGTTGCADRQSADVLGTINGRPLAYPFSSMELSRGNLLCVKNYDASGLLKQQEDMTYMQDTLQFVKSFGQRMFSNGLVINLAYTKEFTFWPALRSRTVTVYPDDGGTASVETTTYSYNGHRLPVKETITRGDVSGTIRTHYSSDVPEMAALSLNNRIIGREQSQNGWLVSAVKQDYRQVPGYTTFVPWHFYQSELSSPTDTASFYQSPTSFFSDPDITVTKADSLGNILESVGRNGTYNTYMWTPDGVSPAGIAGNVRNTFSQSISNVQHTEEDDIFYVVPASSTVPVASFYLGDSGYVSLFFDTSYGQDWGVTLSIDGTGGRVIALSSHGIEESGDLTIQDYINASDHATLLLGSGWHAVRIVEAVSNITEEGEQSEDPMMTYEAGWTEAVVTSSGYDGFMYEDFEEGISPDTWYEDGFHSAGYHTGSYSFTFHADPDVNYILDYRVRRNGDWVYVRQPLGTAANDIYTINEGQDRIDVVRVFPESSTVTTYTYRPCVGVTSATNCRGITESYVYDSLGRLISAIDNDGNPVQSYSYHYATGASINASYPGKTYITSSIPTGAAGASPRESVQYFDGLGRPVQVIQKGASPTSTSVTPVDLADYREYDTCDRPYRCWLTVPVPAGNSRPSGTSVSLSTISSNGLTPYAGDGVRYSETEYDNSPLDIVKTEYGPGAAWRTADKGKRASRLTNDTSGGRLTCKRTVLVWTGNTTFELGAPSIVPAASLNVQSVTDEDGREALTFTDLYGRTVLERRVDTTAVSQNYRFLDTWYLYDKLGRLEAVFPPELSAALTALSNPTASQLAAMPVDEFVFLYRYDARGRCIAKKLPGSGWVYQVYDKGDRPVLTQDAEQRKSSQWTFSLQDALGRDCITGTCSGNWNAFADALGTVQVEVEYAGASGTLMGYTATGITLTNADISSVSYYDEYGFITSCVPFAKRAMLTYQTPATGCDGQYATSALGLETGTAVKVFGKEGESLYLYTARYYDAKGRVVQERLTDHLGGGLFTQLGYAFTGEPLHKRIVHGFANGTSMTEDYSYTYDGWGRLLSTGHSLESGTEVTLSSNSYDSVGRLSRTDRGSSTSAATTYSYNVRSWLTGQTGPYSESLAYNTADDIGNNTPQWGGNVSARQWSVSGEVVAHRYAFEYDGVSRLSSASYSGFTGADYGCTYTYDRNSNIKTQVRKGLFANGTYGIIVNNTYVYNGNQLVGVSNSNQSTYDDNGRLTTDGLNSINAITYNRLNLPETMDFTVQPSSPRSIRNWYSAYGTKLRTEWRTANDTIPKDYVGNLVFVNDTLRTVLVDGGYIDVSYPSSSPQYSYRWFLSDHQGSNRAVINATGDIVRANHYYPYGLEMELTVILDGGPADNVVEQTGYLYKFSGKEQIPQSSLGWYDFGARWYDPIHARWTTPDPMAEKYYSISPYVYCAGNPVNIVDPEGRDVWEIYRDGRVIRKEESKEHILYAVDAYGNRGESMSFSSEDILLQLKKDNTKKETRSINFGADKESVENAIGLFLFLADNTSFEWAVHIGKENAVLGTKYKESNAGYWGDYGLTDVPKTSIHSHPGKYGSKYEKYGEVDDLEGDFKRMKEHPELKANNYYIYYPNSKNTYSIKKKPMQITEPRNGLEKYRKKKI